ncbi:hypothetical protein GGI11_001637 [Coemansia sp. RSA 2049]|nr:hypothetical protein GGI11_001637 [Coemansia sp. RSA 2049]KAJ2617157.1 hypothetical protein EV177_000689 [Coemansia sp. RSA 1804]
MHSPQSAAIGANIDTVALVFEILFVHPVCAVAISATAYFSRSVYSAWFGIYVAVFAVVKISAVYQHICRRKTKADWSEHVVLLTGGAHGIGLSLLRMLAAAGARVAVVDITDIPDGLPSTVRTYRCDLSELDQVHSTLDAITSEMGDITMLVSNAGTLCPQLLCDMSAADIDRVMGVNLLAPMHITRSLLPSMLSKPHAHLVFVASMLSFVPIPQLSTYTASKAGLAIFQESVKLEIQHRLGASSRVKVTSVYPSKVESGMFHGLELPKWFSPSLSPDYAAHRIFAHMDGGYGGEIHLPLCSRFSSLYMLLPSACRSLAGKMVGKPAIIDLTQIDSDESYEYAGFDDDDDEISIVSAWMPNKRIKTEDYYEETPTEISDGFLSKDEQITESVAPTSAYTEIQGSPNTMMVVTEGRGVASEIAYCFIDLNTTQCMVSQFADSASYSRIIYAILTARPQVVLVPKAMANCKSKAMVNIRRYLPWLTVAPLERSLFSDSDGNRRLQDLAIPSQVAPLVRIMAKK